MSKYIALTIGPIYKTLSMARKTRELWASSYLFSYIMKNIIDKLREEKSIKFILPYTKDDDIFDNPKSVGLFHDRFMFEVLESNKDYFDELKKIVENQLNDIAQMIANHLKKDRDKVKSYLDNYFQIYFVEKELSDNENIILELNKYLDSLELQSKVISKDEVNFIKLFMEKINRKSHLWKKALKTQKRFYSLPEIALKELDLENIYESRFIYMKTFEKYDKGILDKQKRDLYEEVKNRFKVKLNNYHKYVAIIQADGDNLGEVIGNLKDENFEDFSKKLFDFAQESHKLIESFGGVTIYAGGDDLLFFAPVIYNEKNIFDLISDISKKYDDLFKDDNEKIEKKTTLSFGLSISYYRFPLYEALEEARNQLFDKAKSANKNAISFRVLKHSGQYFETKLTKDKKSYESFQKLIKTSLSDTNILNALHYKLESQKATIKAIAKDSAKLQNFFDNNFNESIHKDNEFLKRVKSYMDIVFDEYEFEVAFQLIFSSLRTIKFLKGSEI